MVIYRASNRTFEVFFECKEDAVRFAGGRITAGLEVDFIDVIPKQSVDALKENVDED